MEFTGRIEVRGNPNDAASRVELWVNGQLVIDYAFARINWGTSDGSGLGQFMLTPFHTNKDPNQAHPTGYTWYDDLIISTQPIPMVNGAIPTPDTTPPAIASIVVSSITSGAATITWTTNKPADTQVLYGPTSSYGFATPLNTSLVTNHSVSLSGLSPSTTYHFSIRSKDATNNLGASPDITFTTLAPPDTTPPTFSAVAASSITEVSATITWTTNKPANSQLEYGLLISYGSQTPVDTALVTSHSLTISGLTAGTVYNYRLKSADVSGNLGISANFMFSTAPPQPPPTSGLIGYWPFDEGTGTTTADASGHNNNGVLWPNISPLWTTGKVGSALQFNATDNNNYTDDPRVTIGRNLDVSILPFTISAWVNPANFLDWRVIFSKRDAFQVSQMRFDLGLHKDTGTVYLKQPGTSIDFIYSPPTNVWTHLTVVASATDTRLYVNGLLVQTVLGAFALGTGSGANTAIGGTGEAIGADPFNGTIDDVRVYNRAVTASEVQDIYDAAGPTFISNVAASNVTNATATITWTTNKPADSQVDYGTTSSYGQSTPLDPSLVTAHSITLAGLSANSTYHVRVNSKNYSGYLVTSADYTFKTNPPLTTPPPMPEPPAPAPTQSRLFAASVIASGQSSQNTTVNTGFAATLKVTVLDQYGSPFQNTQVIFTAPSSGASLSVRIANAMTDSSGIASLNATANTIAGRYQVTASSGSALPASFDLTNTPGKPVKITATAGTPQTADIRAIYSDPLEVEVQDAFDNPVPQITMTFTVIRTSNASAIFPAGNTVVTDTTGHARVSIRANAAPGSYTVSATSGATKPASFSLTNRGLRSAVVPALSSGRANRLGIALMNPSLNAITVTLTARGYDGNVIGGSNIQNPAQLIIPAGGQTARQATEIFGSGIDGQPGWVQVDSTDPVNGFFLLYDDALQTCDGAALVGTSSSRLIFPHVDDSTILHVVNTGNQTSGFTTVNVYDNKGNLSGSTTIAIAPHAGWSGRIADLVPSLNDVDGYTVIDTSGPFATPYQALVGIATYSKGADDAVVTALDDFALLQTGYAVHIPSGGGYTSRLKLVNLDSVQQQVQLTLNGASVQRTIPGHGRLDESLDQTFNLNSSSTTSGYLNFQLLTKNTAGVGGFVEIAGPEGLLLTAEPITEEAEMTMVFSQVAVADGYWTGLALLSTAQASATVELDSTAGTALASTVVTLEPGRPLVKLLSELFPEVRAQFGGSIRIVATVPVYGLLFFGCATPGNFMADIPFGLN